MGNHRRKIVEVVAIIPDGVSRDTFDFDLDTSNSTTKIQRVDSLLQFAQRRLGSVRPNVLG